LKAGDCRDSSLWRSPFPGEFYDYGDRNCSAIVTTSAAKAALISPLLRLG
jgi:hypothetical protein